MSCSDKDPGRTLTASALVAATTLALGACGSKPQTPAAAPTAEASTAAPTQSGAPKDSTKSDASGTFTIDESNAHVEIPAGTKTVVINGSNNHIQGHEVTEIKINGYTNAVEVDSVKTVSFTGSNNAVQYEDGAAPQTASDSGANNAVTKG